MNDQSRPHRPVRSFVLRTGRMTPGQRCAFEHLWPRFGVDYRPEPLDLATLFGNAHPVYLEIGFGNGNALTEMARRHPACNHLGIEVHTPGVGHLLRRLEEQGSENVRVLRHDAVEVLGDMIPDGTLAGTCLFFPDPWHKKRHHKRRIVQPAFARLLARKLVPGGFFHAATDWEDYALHMLEVLDACPALHNTASDGRFVPRPEDRPLTRFEQRGLRLGHGVWDLVYERR